MVYRKNSHIEIKQEWNPIVVFKSYCKDYAPAYFIPYFRSVYTHLPLECRLIPASVIHREGISQEANVSIKRNKHNLFFTPFLKRNFESNLYDNLSPPVN